jgi:hypothetical protein
MRKNIEFVNNAGKAPDPINKTKEIGFRDLVFREEYRERKVRFTSGLTWLRFLPAVKGSQFDWMMPVEVHPDIQGTTFLSPRSVDSNNQSVFDTALRWLQRNRKELLRSRDKNPNGFNLYPKRYGISWVIEESAPEGQRLKLFYGSLYDGARGANTGLAYNIRREAEARDNEPGSPKFGSLVHGDITNPEAGRLVKVEKNAASTDGLSTYKAGIGQNPAPVEHFLSLLTDDEVDMIVPLERTIHIPSQEEEHDMLRRYIGASVYREIFGTDAPILSSPKVEVEVEEVEPEPEPVRVAPKKAKPVEVEPEVEEEEPTPEESTTPYSTREVTALLAKEKAGVAELLKNRHRLSKTHLEIVLDSAKEYGLE